MSIERFHIQIERPREDGFPGEVECGHYVVENGTLTLTGHNGIPLKGKTGTVYSRTFKPEDDSRSIAGILLRQWRNERPSKSNFNRRITMPRQGFAWVAD